MDENKSLADDEIEKVVGGTGKTQVTTICKKCNKATFYSCGSSIKKIYSCNTCKEDIYITINND